MKNTKPRPVSIESLPQTDAVASGPTLARLLGRSEDGYLVEVAGRPCLAAADDDVDPALLADVIARRGRVVLDGSEVQPVIVGVLQTRRTLELDRQGRLVAELDELAVTARRILLRAPRTFVQLADGGLELYGDKVLTRARSLAKTLAAMIKFN